MATNSRFGSTRTRSLPVPADTKSNDPVKVGALVGVALTDRAADDNRGGGNPDGFATVALDGAYDLEVAGAVSGSGVPVYITSGGSLTATAGENTVFGHTIPGATADGSKGSGTGVVTVEIAQV